MILFSDFDSTLFFRDDEAKTWRNLDAIRRWRAAGHQFCITTGRSHASVTKQMPEMEELCDYFIVDSGSILLDQTGNIIHTAFFEPALIPIILEYSKNFSEVPVPFFYTPESEGVNLTTERVTKLRLWFADTDLIDGFVAQIENAFPVLAFHQHAVSKYEELIEQKGFIEIIPIDGGKNNAILYLQQIKNIPTSDIITAGDGRNDRSMVQDFDGYAIENSDLANLNLDLKTTASLADMIDNLLSKESRE